MITSQNFTESEGVENLLPSKTVPDQSLTLRELLVHYTRGSQLPESKTQPAFFDEDAFIPNLKKLDLVELEELRLENANSAQASHAKLELLREEAQKRQFDLMVEERIKKAAEKTNTNIEKNE